MRMLPRYQILDLFSGIGGFSLGLERAGMTTAAFCEIDPFCRAVLAQHWPGVPIYDDVRELSADALSRDGIAVDVICGGFPCQDLSFAGKRAGLEGARSGLWGEYARLIGELRPRFVIVENVPGLLSLGMGRVLGDLSALGYDATWDCIPACAVGAPHRRDRVWIVAHTNERGLLGQGVGAEQSRRAEAIGTSEAAPDALGDELRQQPRRSRRTGRQGEAVARDDGQAWALADAYGNQQHGRRGSVQMGRQRRAGEAAEDGHACGAEWLSEPDVGRVAHGVPARVDRLRSLGNSVVPQIPEMIGRAIIAAEMGGSDANVA